MSFQVDLSTGEYHSAKTHQQGNVILRRLINVGMPFCVDSSAGECHSKYTHQQGNVILRWPRRTRSQKIKYQHLLISPSSLSPCSLCGKEGVYSVSNVLSRYIGFARLPTTIRTLDGTNMKSITRTNAQVAVIGHCMYYEALFLREIHL
jgi:hypothetical protein